MIRGLIYDEVVAKTHKATKVSLGDNHEILANTQNVVWAAIANGGLAHDIEFYTNEIIDELIDFIA